MGRRKIEIKAIKDDRNRSVSREPTLTLDRTFLKRKGGLFKKAHELSVLCSVDVAVIIFGHNKKLYEFSSGDINETIGRYQYVTQYGGAHEHKGPEDFMGKKDGDDEDEEDEEGAVARDSHTPPEHGMMPHHLQHAQAFQHIRHATPSASPPMPNGGIPFHQRGPSPQPGHLSRPNSRDPHSGRAPSSGISAPSTALTRQPSTGRRRQATMPYMPQTRPFYNPQNAQPDGPGARRQARPLSPHFQSSSSCSKNRGDSLCRQHFSNSSMLSSSNNISTHSNKLNISSRPNNNMYNSSSNNNNSSSSINNSRLKHRLNSNSSSSSSSSNLPNHSLCRNRNKNAPRSPLSPFRLRRNMTSRPRPLHASAKHSIFTPIDDSQSMLAAHWGSSNVSSSRSEVPFIKQENRAQSIDVAAMSRLNTNGISPPQPPPQQMAQEPPQRTQSTSGMPAIQPISRTNSMQTDPKKPRLRVQIPSEQSDAGSATADSSPKDSGTTGATPARTGTEGSHSSGVVLPPPSPSANSLMSAGATGPPNPFCSPPATIQQQLLLAASGPSFARDDSADRERKRKTSDDGSDSGQKRVKA
ncbi:hypothetical protein SNOG_15194 [Parastagonospora nodorum SN15]|uniref:MADS-box domain-containing protein n=1 Tax=Phaeosphaeria nodorum (strain SN15 / ATCC MYA-4574 / FGSC 10173) TaxID=321614 RepID=Q0TZ66_PHANO|nr:hypothetical protein SNOG_15194 [Parastagonospora nodorum SN15]EAT77419.2 hypothetical protein SNOG_15194 [Parastagonospora nodorum SN15]